MLISAKTARIGVIGCAYFDKYMKTTDENAAAYADRVFESAIGKTWGEMKQAFADAYLAGATEALAGQWRSVEDELPDENEVVLARYLDYVGLLEYGCAYYDGKDWYSTEGTLIRPAYWMPIPSLPIDARLD